MLVACGDSGGSPRQEVGAVAQPRADAAIIVEVGSAAPTPRAEEEPRPPLAPSTQPARPARPIDITLRSTPSGARVAVDGAPIGNTPAYWMGTADGHEHEFVFELRGHAIARYRFVPITSGVIHPRLEAITEELDAGVAPPPEVVPHPPTKSSIAPPPAPPTAPPPDAAEQPQMPGLGPQP
jgi:hypothetical protein